MRSPYNPLDKRNLGESVAKALLESATHPMSDLGGIPAGAGVYAIYYLGDFALYAAIAAANRDGAFGMPIYVGKAVPQGARKGGTGFDAGEGTALRRRLADHAKSLNQAQNLELRDFAFRALTVDDIWIPLGEAVLIQRFRPLWNVVLDGFGNHDPGTRRANQYRSPWDVLHPGRNFAAKLAHGPWGIEEIETRVRLALADK